MENQDYLRVKEIIRTENDILFDKLKEFTSEKFETKLDLEKKLNEFKEKHITPMKIKVYSAVGAIGIVVVILQLRG
jgi:hypothetical protein